MSTEIKKFQDFFEQTEVQTRLQELIGDDAKTLIVTVLYLIKNNNMLVQTSPASIYGAMMLSAVLQLPPMHGYSYIVPYRHKDNIYAQYIIGARGYKQLCIRSGLYKRITETDVREGELISADLMKGIYEFRWHNLEERSKHKIIGYLSYMESLSGFENTVYMTYDEIKEHAWRYSESMKKGVGLWVENFEAMARKTVTRKNLSNYGVLTNTLRTALNADNRILLDEKTTAYPEELEEEKTDEKEELAKKAVKTLKIK